MIGELEQIKRILREDWDPIGICATAPDDEYDSYAFEVFVMLKQGKQKAQIAEYLRWVETEHMGLEDSCRHDGIAEMIVNSHERRP